MGKIKDLLPSSRRYNQKQFENIQEQFNNLEKQIKELNTQNKQLKKDIKAFNEREFKHHSDQMKKMDNKTNDINRRIDAKSNQLTQYIDSELTRRDNWPKKHAQIQLEAKNKPIWVIKCPAPEDDAKIRWGDYHYALSLKKYLEQNDIYVVVDTRQDWNYEEFADVVLVLRGCLFYLPDRRNKSCIYIMWNISHANAVTLEEYKLYDIVCIASKYYTQKIKAQLPDKLIVPLEQCTDTDIFYPVKNTPLQYDYIFIGNSRGIARNSVIYAIKNHLSLTIWGGGWHYIIPNNMDMVKATEIENKDIPDVYRSSKVTLNDHWKDMLDNRFINNRIFDALACGLPIISDYCDELQEIFPDSILYYQNEEEFKECVNKLENNYDEIKSKCLSQFDLIQKNYSFDVRAKQLIKIVNEYC